ncbi:MAG: patatin-like phospholipase family protein [Phycisphaeraceae bacterium]|nr:patatin-like phospholipase family protein [Phycisphaeraceae bacterium]
MTQKFRILSLSGGGIRGVYSASFLAKLEEFTGKRVADHFDLIVGTSTGGLIALGLGLGHSASDIRKFYFDHGEKIFTKRPWLMRKLNPKASIRPKYAQDGLRKALKGLLGEDVKLGESNNRLVINAMYAEGSAPRCYKTRHHPEYDRDHREPAWDVGLSTSAAPIFFPANLAVDGKHHLDGGLWANCPIVVGIAEAIGKLGQRPEDLDILSIGTCRHSVTPSPLALIGGVLPYVLPGPGRLHEVIMEAQRAAAMNTAQIMLGEGAILEIDDLVDKGRFEMDNTSASHLNDLRTHGEAKAEKRSQEIATRFLAVQAAPFTAIPENRAA